MGVGAGLQAFGQALSPQNIVGLTRISQEAHAAPIRQELLEGQLESQRAAAELRPVQAELLRGRLASQKITLAEEERKAKLREEEFAQDRATLEGDKDAMKYADFIGVDMNNPDEVKSAVQDMTMKRIARHTFGVTFKSAQKIGHVIPTQDVESFERAMQSYNYEGAGRILSRINEDMTSKGLRATQKDEADLQGKQISVQQQKIVLEGMKKKRYSDEINASVEKQLASDPANGMQAFLSTVHDDNYDPSDKVISMVANSGQGIDPTASFIVQADEDVRSGNIPAALGKIDTAIKLAVVQNDLPRVNTLRGEREKLEEKQVAINKDVEGLDRIKSLTRSLVLDSKGVDFSNLDSIVDTLRRNPKLMPMFGDIGITDNDRAITLLTEYAQEAANIGAKQDTIHHKNSPLFKNPSRRALNARQYNTSPVEKAVDDQVRLLHKYPVEERMADGTFRTAYVNDDQSEAHVVGTGPDGRVAIMAHPMDPTTGAISPEGVQVPISKLMSSIIQNVAVDQRGAYAQNAATSVEGFLDSIFTTEPKSLGKGKGVIQEIGLGSRGQEVGLTTEDYQAIAVPVAEWRLAKRKLGRTRASLQKQGRELTAGSKEQARRLLIEKSAMLHLELKRLLESRK